MRVALDSSVILYAEGLNDPGRKASARAVVAKLGSHELILPLQAAGEVFKALVRKFGRAPAEANAVVSAWQELAAAQPETRDTTFAAARELAVSQGLPIWDAIILMASAEAGCRLLLSEDMQDGFAWRGVTVANPFAAAPHPLLASLLRS